MIEIMVTDIANYDMVQVLNKVAQGEKVVLVHDNAEYHIIPNHSQTNHDRKLAFDDFFAKMKGRLPKDYQFDREEIYDRS